MTKKKFLALMCPIGGLALALGVTLAVVSNVTATKTIFDTYLGKGQAHVQQVEGSENWNTDYYSQQFSKASSAGGNAQAQANSEKVVEKITDEGMVLLKNSNNALPISTSTGITLLGRGSVDPIYGGSGSGNVDTTTCANPKSGIEKAGFKVDTDAYNFFLNNYSQYDRQNIVMDNYDGSTFFIGEIPVSKYDFNVNKNNVAIVFISRCGGEGLDLSTDIKRDSAITSASLSAISNNPNTAAEVANYVNGQHELELSKEEKDMIAFAKQNYAKTIIVLNESTTMEIGDLKNDSGINAIIWAGSPGSTGFNSLGKILSGVVNPSGKTPDIYSVDFTADPTFVNFAINGEHLYTGFNPEDGTFSRGTADYNYHMVEYEEGIYQGYKYYETRGLTDGESWYQSNVVYPFGYGLSYTSFSKQLIRTDVSGNTITMTVKVTNTGNVAGKEVVQLYYTAPYTNGGIEKSSTVLADFAKTGLLAAGASEEVTVSVDIDEMSSYDYKNHKAYVLDAGNYVLQIKENSHEVSQYNGANLEYTYNNLFERVLEKRESDKVAVTNQFEELNEYMTSGRVTQMSRANFAGTFPTKATASDVDANAIKIGGKSLVEYFKKFDATTLEKAGDVSPTMGANNGLSISSLRGIDYEDEAWDLLMDQLTAEDYKNLSATIGNGAYIVKGIESIGLIDCELHDGPQGFSTLFGKLNNVCAFMSEPLLAATFNKELAKEMGTAIGEEALALNPLYVGWYGPAMNTHRSPFAGRNFEYYSEDGVLGGKIAAEVVAGAADKGLVGFIKHFACNDQETWRTAHLCTWLNEQCLRENILKPFELCVKLAKTNVKYLDEAGNMLSKEMNATTAVMSSFNYVGYTWAGGHRALQTNVLRNEWGFRGMVESDFNLYEYMDGDQATYAGTDLQLSWSKGYSSAVKAATQQQYVRTAIKNIAFAMCNSNAMQGVAPGGRVYYDISPWRIGTIIGEIVLFAGAGAVACLVLIKLLKKEEK